jgi:hypothetical protein
MISPIVTTLSTTSLKSQLDNFFQKIESSEDLLEDLLGTGFVPNDAGCSSLHDITKYIPLWVVYEKQELENGSSTQISIFDFLQKYYDWLYCDNSSGSQYYLSSNLLDLIDIEKTKTNFYEKFAKNYADGFDVKLIQGTNPAVTNESFISFIKNIRKNIHQRKTTIEAIKYFFLVLFAIDDVTIYEPKRDILRLNGGAFSNENFSFINEGETGDYEERSDLAGSYLNHSRMQDSNWIQEYSYLLKAGYTAELYRETYLNMLHPAGLNVFLEKTIEDYQGPENPDVIQTVSEIPLLENYAPYEFSTNYTTAISSFNGITLYGLTFCSGCTLKFDPFESATHVFPKWAGSIDQSITNFWGINIDAMFGFFYEQGATSPNYGLTCGNCP